MSEDPLDYAVVRRMPTTAVDDRVLSYELWLCRHPCAFCGLPPGLTPMGDDGYESSTVPHRLGGHTASVPLCFTCHHRLRNFGRLDGLSPHRTYWWLWKVVQAFNQRYISWEING